MYEKLLEFETAMEGPIGIYVPDHALVDLRFTLIEEEFLEVTEELAELDALAEAVREGKADPKVMDETKANLTKELADLLYVTLGTAVALGLPIVDAFNEVHRSNMSKLDADGKPIRREDGKIMKGDGYTPPNIRQYIK